MCLNAHMFVRVPPVVEVTLALTCQGWITFAIETHNALGLLQNGMHVKILYPARRISQDYLI